MTTKIKRGVILVVTLFMISLIIPTSAYAATSSTNVAFTYSFNSSGVSAMQTVTLTKTMHTATAAAVGGGDVTLFVLDVNDNYLDSIAFPADGVSRTYNIYYPANTYHMYFIKTGTVTHAAVAFS